MTCIFAAFLTPAFATEDQLPPPDLLQIEQQRGLERMEPLRDDPSLDVVLTGATLFTATGQVYVDGWIALQDGKITGLGTDTPPDLGLPTFDVSGKFITPGLIDSHSHLGVYPSPRVQAHADGNEATRPTTPGVWAEHSVWPQDPGLQGALAGGITALQVLPGSANLIGGRGVVLQMVPARGSRAMRFPGAPETVKMACGENPKRVYADSGPSTRMGNLAGQRQAFLDAGQYAKKWSEYSEGQARWEAMPERKRSKSGQKPPEPPERNLDQETLVGVLNGDILPHVHCYRADDMLSFLQLAREMDFQLRSFHHCLEAYKIRDILASEEVACSTWADWWGFKAEAYDGIMENAALVHAAGGRAIIHSDSALDIQRLNQEAAKALHAGRQAGLELADDDAIGWITANPAWSLGIDAVTGTLEPGKRADVVVWDEHPLSVYAKAEYVFVEGVLRYKQGAEPWSDFELGQEVPR